MDAFGGVSWLVLVDDEVGVSSASTPDVVTIPRPRFYRRRRLLADVGEAEVLKLFRLSSSTILELYNILKEDLEPRATTNHALPGLSKLLGALHFFAVGASQPALSVISGISQASFSRNLSQVLKAFRRLTPDFIKWPSENEWTEIKYAFYKMGGMPNVMGAIDCTHIAVTPPQNTEESFRNRKCFHSLNVQMVCDSHMKIRNLVAGFPGSSHDSFILRQSYLYSHMEESKEPGWLVGDAGYPLLPWLLTPLSNPQSAADKKYQSAHITTRGIIERTFGLLKSRFRCLDRSSGVLLYSPSKVCDIINACAILHNICVSKKMNFDIEPDVFLDQDLNLPAKDPDAIGSGVRTKLINNFFFDNPDAE